MPRRPNAAEPSDKVLDPILARIREVRNFDFRNYKRATLHRRIERRMTERKLSSYADYVALLQTDHREIDALISAMLIKVSSFFRDDEPWSLLQNKIIPAQLSKKLPGEEFRVWCAGCATGEEVFTIAMVMAEVLGPAFATYPLKIFGTDVDEGAIAAARRAAYPAAAVEELPGGLRERWFQDGPEGATVRKELRRAVVFGINNLVKDAPISHLDLLICRNVFIYLDSTLQKRVLGRFHYALRSEGTLLLGKSELIPFAAKVFQPLDLSRRIYRKEGRADFGGGAQERLLGLLEEQNVARHMGQSSDELTALEQYHQQALQSLAMPIIVTNVDGAVTLWNRAAARLWNKPFSEVLGKKLATLNLAGLPGELLIDKTARVREGRSERETTGGTLSPPQRESMYLSIDVCPFRNEGQEIVGLIYIVNDVTAHRALENDLRHANEERQSSNEELQTTNEELQSANEELETTNEELQSANEELQTTNEELQSTNEELETTNEELESANEELDTTNRELAHRTEELNLLGFYQRTIIRTLSAAVMVLDQHGRITLWNLAAERLLGLAENEAIGQSLWTLHIPAFRQSVMQKVRQALAGNLASRTDTVPYTLPNGERGWGVLAAVPLIERGANLGAVVVFEDNTRSVALSKANNRLKKK
ncbi:MAG TPA: CheR family methyltransferase [Polyangia bacterium]|nr:CheR family methyltransferase [Polyangia bacterium]